MQLRGMSPALIAELPVLTRLALSYTPSSAKPATLALFALDRQLGSIARTSSEPMLAQLRLAWWRDALSKPADLVSGGNPVLDAALAWPMHRGALVALIDGWEALVTSEAVAAGAAALVAARAGAGAALAEVLGEPQASDAAGLAARQWALADLVHNISPGTDRDGLAAELRAAARRVPELPRSLRALAVLGAAARQQALEPDPGIHPRPRVLFKAVRTGLFGF